MNVVTILLTYLAAINIVGFAVMGLDKYKAKKHAFRVPESTLFILAVIGGSIGCIAGMYTFRHKTRKWYFVYGMPVILLLQAVLCILIFYSPLDITMM